MPTSPNAWHIKRTTSEGNGRELSAVHPLSVLVVSVELPGARCFGQQSIIAYHLIIPPFPSLFHCINLTMTDLKTFLIICPEYRPASLRPSWSSSPLDSLTIISTVPTRKQI